MKGTVGLPAPILFSFLLVACERDSGAGDEDADGVPTEDIVPETPWSEDADNFVPDTPPEVPSTGRCRDPGHYSVPPYTVGGKEFSYEYLVPERCLGPPTPLLIVVHGQGGDSGGMMLLWEDFARQNGFILAAPSSVVRGARNWRILDRDTLGLFERMIDEIAAAHEVDLNRVYMSGISAGAQVVAWVCLGWGRTYASCSFIAGGRHPDPRAAVVFHDERMPPSLIVIGNRDPMYTEAEDLKEELEGHGAEVIFEVKRGYGHDPALIVDFGQEIWDFHAATCIDC